MPRHHPQENILYETLKHVRSDKTALKDDPKEAEFLRGKDGQRFNNLQKTAFTNCGAF